MNIEWASPYWLLLLPMLPLLLYWHRRRSGARIRLPRTGMMHRSGLGSRRWLGSLPLWLRCVTLLFLILVLAGPRTPGGLREAPPPGVPIVIALDVSSSMLAEDFGSRNRLEVAKSTVEGFVRRRRDDPIGLVAFAAEALTLVPVTTYESVLVQALNSLQVGLLEDGTAVGEGLVTSINRLRRLPAESRVVILMSDGVNNRGTIDPLSATQVAADLGIRVYTIGVGSSGVARIPVPQERDGSGYAELPVEVDEELLREIARRTGGQYFRATDPEALRRIYGQIDRLVTSPAPVAPDREYHEWAPLLLLSAALVLLLEWLLRGSRWGVMPG